MSRLPIDIMLDQLAVGDDVAFSLARERAARIEQASVRTIPELELEDPTFAGQYKRKPRKLHANPSVAALQKRLRLAINGVDVLGQMPASSLTPGHTHRMQYQRSKVGPRNPDYLMAVLTELEERAKDGTLTSVQKTEVFAEGLELLSREGKKGAAMAQTLSSKYPSLSESYGERLAYNAEKNLRAFKTNPNGKGVREAAEYSTRALKSFEQGMPVEAFLQNKIAGTARIPEASIPLSRFKTQLSNMQAHGERYRTGRGRGAPALRGEDVSELTMRERVEIGYDLDRVDRGLDPRTLDRRGNPIPASESFFKEEGPDVAWGSGDDEIPRRGGGKRKISDAALSEKAIRKAVARAADAAREADVAAAMSNFEQLTKLNYRNAVAMGMTAQDAKDLAFIQKLGRGVDFGKGSKLEREALKKAGPAILRFIRAVTPL